MNNQNMRQAIVDEKHIRLRLIMRMWSLAVGTWIKSDISAWNNSKESLLEPRKRLSGVGYLDCQGFTALLEWGLKWWSKWCNKTCRRVDSERQMRGSRDWRGRYLVMQGLRVGTNQRMPCARWTSAVWLKLTNVSVLCCRYSALSTHYIYVWRRWSFVVSHNSKPKLPVIKRGIVWWRRGTCVHVKWRKDRYCIECFKPCIIRRNRESTSPKRLHPIPVASCTDYLVGRFYWRKKPQRLVGEFHLWKYSCISSRRSREET